MVAARRAITAAEGLSVSALPLVTGDGKNRRARHSSTRHASRAHAMLRGHGRGRVPGAGHEPSRGRQDPAAGPGEASRQEVLHVLQWPDGSPLSQNKRRSAHSSSAHSSGIQRLRGQINYPELSASMQEICDCKWFNRPKYFNGTLENLLTLLNCYSNFFLEILRNSVHVRLL